MVGGDRIVITVTLRAWQLLTAALHHAHIVWVALPAACARLSSRRTRVRAARGVPPALMPR